MSEDKINDLYGERNNAEHNRVFNIMGMHTALMILGLGLSIYVAISLGDLIQNIKIQHRVTLTHFEKDRMKFAQHSKEMSALDARITELEKIILKNE